MRGESHEAVNQVRNLGIKTVMLTGDNTNAAHFIAQQLGIDNVQAALLPEYKIEKITEYLKEYRYVAMIGDGVNDAPALAKASVGITLGAVGSDLAIENADIALMNNDLKLVPYLIRLGRKCSSKIRFNIALALGVKSLFILLAVSGASSLAMAIFADVGVTLLVVINSLSLFKFDFR
jgi:Cd2+/Zn2+-exporting ATPase